ncbi:hypothetical protein ARAM_006647 [Aspergillus rambellii]|uniref:Glycosyl transferase CAP10 domain-containing protein n=1 Tax=Aspergillus rambellii TaxID=308745 RepID=A0A0F8TY13_9EURO|nr:hypothetical protein ARAM_006647 [Aspergillus rambellii]
MVVACPSGLLKKFSSTGVRSRFHLLTGVSGLLFVLVAGVYLFPRYHGPGWDLDHTFLPAHPIDHLIAAANKQWRTLLTQETHTLQNATAKYRQRRGRHPPPGFEEWYRFAKEKDAVMIEDLFDQIYHDLSPYWGIEPKELRRQASGFSPRIAVRNRTAIPIGHIGVGWMEAWVDLMATIEKHLPDLDMPLNGMDEPRVIVPWEDIAQYVAKDQQAAQQLLDPKDVAREYMALSDLREDDPNAYDPGFTNGGGMPYWYLARMACPPESPSRLSDIRQIDFAAPPPEFYNYQRLSQHGYLKNWTLSKDPCSRPELQFLHGSFIEPITVSTTAQLFPIFGGSKLPVNNDILIPPAMYWADNELYSGGNDNHGGRWSAKKDLVFWRGVASGGRHREHTWAQFQRHRFLSMLNATSVAIAEDTTNRAYLDFRLPDQAEYDLACRRGAAGQLPALLHHHTDLGFIGLQCFPDPGDAHCPYTDPYFELVPPVPMKLQYDSKYLPDLDGNSFSGRYRAFLLSTSLPIKGTIYNEWHDSRLIAWAHFIPMDTTYMDIYGILEYFLGYGDYPGHDSMAQKVALNGKAWAERVLRKEDMQIYIYRLLLEYARICDDRRAVLAYVDDI